MTEGTQPIYKDTPAANKMRAVRANPWHRKIIRAKANLKRMSKLVAEHEVMRRKHPGLTETQQVYRAGICYRNLLVLLVIYKYNYITRHQNKTNNV